jgi:hypothetical protein
MIAELIEFWSFDPKYKDSLQIQGKYSFDQRPQQAIILKGSSANPIRFSADNFQGTVDSYCHLTKAFGKNGTSIEWVQEDRRAVQRNNGIFPSLPGIYYIEVRREPFSFEGVVEEYLVFYIDPLLSAVDERPTQIDPLTYEVVAGKFTPNSLVVWELPGNLPYYEDINYTADPTTGRITLTEPLPSGVLLSVDYYVQGTSTGPFPVEENGANSTAIPGVAMAFGRRAYEGDMMAVVVSRRREESAREFGGKWEMSLDFDIMARDVHAQGEINDRTLMFLNAELRDRLSFEGIEIDQVSGGGESEEPYDDVGDDYFYNSSISVTLMTDWSIRLPLDRAINRIIPGSLTADKAIAGLSDEQLLETGRPNGYHLTDVLGLSSIRDPWFKDRTQNYEMIR